MTRSSWFLRRVAPIMAAFFALGATLCFAQNASELNAPTDKVQKGAMVDGVADGGQAAKAGISAHDFITAVEGTPAESWKRIIEALVRHKPGDTMSLTVAKASGGATAEVTLTLAPSPIDPSQPYMGLIFVVGNMLRVPKGQMPPDQRQPPPGV